MVKSVRKKHRRRILAFIATWGLAEAMLDICIMSIFRRHKGAAINPEVPNTLERKIGFLKRAYTEIPDLAPFQEEAVEVARLFASEKDLRNTVVHTAPLKIDPDGTAHYVRLRAKGGRHFLELRSIKPTEWKRLLNVTAHLIVHLMVLTTGTNRSGLEEPDEPIRKGKMKLFAGFPVSKRLYDLLAEVSPFGTGE